MTFTLIVLGIVLLAALLLNTVSVTYEAKATVLETLPNNTDSASTSKRQVTHSNFDQAATLNSGTTPPVTQVAEFKLTLTDGAATIDLRALTGTNGASVDGNGLKPQIVRVKNLGANALTIEPGASNGHDLFGASSLLIVPPGAHVQFFTNDGVEDIDATHKTLDVTGTGAQTSEWTIVMG